MGHTLWGVQRGVVNTPSARSTASWPAPFLHMQKHISLLCTTYRIPPRLPIAPTLARVALSGAPKAAHRWLLTARKRALSEGL